MKIVVLERKSVGMDVDMSCYEEFGEVTYYDNTTTKEEAAQRITEAEIVIANKAPLCAQVLEQAKQLKMICVLATGYDVVDIAYCRAHGIRVANVVDYSSAMVAQHAVTLALALSGKIAYYDQFVKSGAYSAQSSFSHFEETFCELDGKTWGIVGMGNIGRRTARIAQALGCRIITHSLTGKGASAGYELVSKDELLARSDVLSLHCPLSDLSRHYIDADALRKMKKSAVLINVARGAVVDTQALYEALHAGEIAAAGLDVLDREPMAADNPLGRIKDSCRLLITPHLAWASVEARRRCVQGVYMNIKAFIQGEERNVVC